MRDCRCRFFLLACDLRRTRAAVGVSVSDAIFDIERLVNVRLEKRAHILEFGKRQIGQNFFLLNALRDRASHDRVRLAERKAFFRQIISHIRRVREIGFQDGAGVIAADRHRPEHSRVNIKRESQRIDCIKDAFLVLLHILIVRQRQALHRRQKRHEMADRPSRLTANELADIRILFLRHDRAARAVAVVELDEMKFARAPENQFFGQARQMHHANRREREKFQDIIAIRDRIETVSVTFRKMQFLCRFQRLRRIRRPGQRCRAQRRDVRHVKTILQPPEIARKHRKIREHMMREKHRLRPLQMRVAGQNHVLIFLGNEKERLADRRELFRDMADVAAHVHMRVHRRLVIAAPRRVKPRARIPDSLRQPLFDIHMDIFERNGKFEIPGVNPFPNVRQSLGNRAKILRRENAVRTKHLRVRQRPRDILAIHPPIKRNRRIEILRGLFLRLGKAAAPHRLTHFSFFSFMRARIVRGSPKRLMKPPASAWLYTSSSPKVTNSSL